MARIERIWDSKALFKGTGGWPAVSIVMHPKAPKPLREKVRDATAFTRESFGLVNTSNQWWVRSGPVIPAEEPIEIEPYAAVCVERFRDTWLAVHEAVEQVVRGCPALG